MPPPRHGSRNSGRFLPILTGIGVAALLGEGIIRATAYLAHALWEIPAPDQPHVLEGAFVHFARCVQTGMPLYPEGQGPLYTCNYMGPCYYWIVGALGRVFDADIHALYLIGRVVTFVCAFGPAAIAALYLWRRYGRRAGLAGFIFGLGSAPMIGYGAMVRPDMMADFLGAAGFLVVCACNRRWLPLAAVLLALGVLTKQTAGVWLLAAVVVLLSRHAWRHALSLSLAAVALVLAVVAILAETGQPHVFVSLFSQGGIPLDSRQQIGVMRLLLDQSPEMLFFALVGCGMWINRRYKDRALLILTCLWLAAAIFTCAKRGSSLNYFLPLRLTEAIAAGMLCVAALRSRSHRLVWAVLAMAAAAVMAPSTVHALQAAQATAKRLARLDTESGRAKQREFDHYARLAQDPTVRMLTDCDRLAVYQGARAVLFDPYSFRLQVETGQLDPQELVDRLQSRWFQYVILSADVSGVYSEFFFHRLPTQVATAVKANYRLQSHEAGLFVYVPRESATKKVGRKNGVRNRFSLAAPVADTSHNTGAFPTSERPPPENHFPWPRRRSAGRCSLPSG
jgi:hypothetical protein